MTDTKAPERLWTWTFGRPVEDKYTHSVSSSASIKEVNQYKTEYIRADLYEAQAARIAELETVLQDVANPRTMTDEEFADLNTRVKKALPPPKETP